MALAALEDKSHPAWQRLIAEELLAQQLALRRVWLERRNRGAPMLAAAGVLSARFERLLAQPAVAAAIDEARPFFRYYPGRAGLAARFLPTES